MPCKIAEENTARPTGTSGEKRAQGGDRGTPRRKQGLFSRTRRTPSVCKPVLPASYRARATAFAVLTKYRPDWGRLTVTAGAGFGQADFVRHNKAAPSRQGNGFPPIIAGSLPRTKSWPFLWGSAGSLLRGAIWLPIKNSQASWPKSNDAHTSTPCSRCVTNTPPSTSCKKPC